MPPSPSCRESLEKLQPKADVLVVSATPNEALHREWEEHDIAAKVRGGDLRSGNRYRRKRRWRPRPSTSRTTR